MSFNITTPERREVDTALATPLDEIYANFATEFDRVSPITAGSGSLESDDPTFSPDVSRWNLRGLDNPEPADPGLGVKRTLELDQNHDIEEMAYHTSRMVLEASGVAASPFKDDDKKLKPSDSDEAVAGLRIAYHVRTPSPKALLGVLGIRSLVRGDAVDSFGHGMREVFSTDFMTQEDDDSYEATLVKPVFYVVTKALEGLPDAKRRY